MSLPLNTIIQGDALNILRTFPDESVNCVVTSPPYWGLRDYGISGQLGLERTPEEYVEKMVGIFGEVRRVLRKDGTVWLNLGDSYNAGRNGGWAGGLHGISRPEIAPKQSGVNAHGLKPKDLVGIPWRVAFALQADGWWLRSDIIWSKPNPMPESVTDRPTKAHEYVFLLAKSEKYYFNQDAVREPQNPKNLLRYGSPFFTGQKEVNGSGRPDGASNTGGMKKPPDGGRNAMSVWTISVARCAEAHFATFPEALVRHCILAGCPTGGIVLDPFGGAGTV